MMLKKNRILFICLVSLCLTTPMTALAGADSGLYIGFGAGDTSIEGGGFDVEDSGYKVFGGFNFGVVPFVDVAVEASYVDFGEFGIIDVTGANAFGLVGLNFGPFGVFAKAGVLDWEIESDIGALDGESGTDSAYAVGAKFAIGSFAVRAEYEVFDLDDVDLDMISISGTYTF
jgi:hypothetical protein